MVYKKILFTVDDIRFLCYKKLSPALTVPRLSHLTSCIPTEFNLYLAVSLTTVPSDVLTFHVRKLLSLFHCLWRRGQLKCDGTRTETRFRLSAKQASPFRSAGASVQSTTGSRGVRINGSNAGYTMFRGSVKGTGYPLHSPVSPSLPLPSSPVRHHVPSHFNRSLDQSRPEAFVVSSLGEILRRGVVST